jgi:biotin transport system substrate-specific component
MNFDLEKQTRSFFLAIPEKSVGFKVFLAFFGAYLTSVSAHVAIPLPFTPIPMTLQVFTVLALGGLLGSFYGGLSQIIYIALGMGGLPWYVGGASSFGLTAGYLAGFIAAAGVTGHLVQYPAIRNSQWKTVLAMLAGDALILGLGGLYFSILTGSSFEQTFALAVLPFILPDLFKAVAAGSLVWWLRKK